MKRKKWWHLAPVMVSATALLAIILADMCSSPLPKPGTEQSAPQGDAGTKSGNNTGSHAPRSGREGNNAATPTPMPFAMLRTAYSSSFYTPETARVSAGPFSEGNRTILLYLEKKGNRYELSADIADRDPRGFVADARVLTYEGNASTWSVDSAWRYGYGPEYRNAKTEPYFAMIVEPEARHWLDLLGATGK